MNKHLLLLLATVLALSAGQQRLDPNTCRLMCVSCEKSRQVFSQQCVSTASVNATAAECPCLQLPQASQAPDSSKRQRTDDSINCPEQQPPADCPPGSFVRCRLVGPLGRCFGECACLPDTEESAQPEEHTVALLLTCRLPQWLGTSCRRYCRRKFGGDGRLLADERGCELCRCCRHRSGLSAVACFEDNYY